MPTWGQVLKEINEAQAQLQASGQSAEVSGFDVVRRHYLRKLSEFTGRPTIAYSSAWMASAAPNVSPNLISISVEDIHGLMEASHGIPQGPLDLIIHSPGGSPTAAEAIVQYLRSRFSHIRVIVPHMAMSAATMLACAADEIIMGKHSFLGPIDPQLIMQTSLGVRSVPAQAILDQFQRAQEECADPVKLRAWLPMLNQFGPDLIVTCNNATDLSKRLVADWLNRFMLRNQEKSAAIADEIAQWLSGHNNFKDHSRPIGREELRDRGLSVIDLEANQDLQDLVLSVFHATSITFTSTPVVKIIENQSGKAFLKFAS